MAQAYGEIGARGMAGEATHGVQTLVVDDQEAFRDVMRDLVSATPGFELAGEAASGEAALALVGELDPQLVLMDVRMPGIGGIEATRVLVEGRPDLPVVLVSVEDLNGLPEVFGQCGAAAFVRKQDLRPQRLQELWREARQQLTYSVSARS